MNKIRISAPAKLNLTLDIAGVRHDGYHLLRTIMQTVDIYDYITIEKNASNSTIIECDSDYVPCDERNLVHRAITEFFNSTGIEHCGITAGIDKHIPAMAGMAGGSTDAAAALIGLDKMFSTNLNIEQLCKIGVKLGADVPFCLFGGTAVCEGIGEIITKLKNLSGCVFVVVKPDISISTPEAFKKYDSIDEPDSSDFIGMCTAIEKSIIPSVGSKLFNALSFAANDTSIHDLCQKLIANGAVGSSMTGSGSACFGIFDDEKTASKCVDLMNEQYPFCKLCRPIEHSCVISYIQ